MKTFNVIWRRIRDLYGGRYQPEGLRPLAELYWRSLLVVSFFAIWFAILYGIWDMTGVLSTLAASPDTSPPPPSTLNKMTLDALVQEFDFRQQGFDSFTPATAPAVADPSR